MKVMEKKEYIAPACEVIEMETNVSMMALSFEEGEEWGDGETQDANRHRGEWGNLWGRGE